MRTSRNSGSYIPRFFRVRYLALQSARAPAMRKPMTAPRKAPVYAYPVCTSFHQLGGPMKTAASITPMNTVHPIMQPWMRHAQRIAGCAKRGNGLKKSLKKASSVILPLIGSSDSRKVFFRSLGVTAPRLSRGWVGGLPGSTSPMEGWTV